MARDGEVKQRQHFYHHGDTICHPKSGYSLLCGPISPVVNLEMSSTARFFVEMQYMGAQH